MMCGAIKILDKEKNYFVICDLHKGHEGKHIASPMWEWEEK